jgi:CheY-like chemotaxis protein
MKLHVLGVEDNHLTQLVLKALFTRVGCDYASLWNGKEVLPYLEKNAVDVIILDLDLPGMTGDEIYKAISENPNYRRIVVIPFTAHADKRSKDVLPPHLVNKVPEIIYTLDRTGDPQDINKQLVQTVADNLVEQGHALPAEMSEYLR